jgi:hypothetical protein
MKRIIIICEGQTEQAFCNDVLQSHFNASDIYIEFPTIKKSEGGIISWHSLKKQVINHLKQDKTAIVTTLIDYYGIKPKHDFPQWQESLSKSNKTERLLFLENAMITEIDDSLRNRFFPYLQLHEFEGLLFSDLQVFDNNFEEDEFNDYDYLVETIEAFNNPEMINDGNETAPSKRLSKIINSYDKTIMGPILASETGLATIRQKCPRFNEWITKLENC